MHAHTCACIHMHRYTWVHAHTHMLKYFPPIFASTWHKHSVLIQYNPSLLGVWTRLVDLIGTCQIYMNVQPNLKHQDGGWMSPDSCQVRENLHWPLYTSHASSMKIIPIVSSAHVSQLIVCKSKWSHFQPLSYQGKVLQGPTWHPLQGKQPYQSLCGGRWVCGWVWDGDRWRYSDAFWGIQSKDTRVSFDSGVVKYSTARW